MRPYTPPKFNEAGFDCPHCAAYANQVWWTFKDGAGIFDGGSLRGARCQHCTKYTVWLNGEMLYPDAPGVPLPNPDLPSEIQDDYREAAGILNKSPRASAALLRLAIQKLCKSLGESGDINVMIGNLVKRGLPVQVQQALDIVRVIGNNAVHPGTIDLTDDRDTAAQLFGLVNIIAQVMLTQPKEIAAMYASLPEGPRKAIEKRDDSGTP